MRLQLQTIDSDTDSLPPSFPLVRIQAKSKNDLEFLARNAGVSMSSLLAKLVADEMRRYARRKKT